MTYFVVVRPKEADPWVLSLDGYQTVAAADRAMNWQRQFNPETEFSLCVVRNGQLAEYIGGRVIVPGSAPYTEATWAAFLERNGL